MSINTNTNEVVFFWTIDETDRERTVGSLTFTIVMPMRYLTDREYKEFGFSEGLKFYSY